MRKGRGKEQQGGALVVECLTLGEPNLRVDLRRARNTIIITITQN